MSASDLLRRLDEAATPGPWREAPGVDRTVVVGPKTIGPFVCGEARPVDRRLIAALRTLLPELRAVVEAVVRPGVEGGIECGICLASWDPHGSGLGADSEWHHDYCALRALDARAAELLAERDAEQSSEGGTDG